MKCIPISFFSLVAVVLSTYGYAQQKADIGIRLNTADNNRLQVEFRKPVSENYSFRVSGSVGQTSSFPWSKVSDASDSLVVTRNQYWSADYCDLRFGLDRKLKWDYISIYSDLIFGYSRTGYTAWNTFSVKDSMNNWNSSHQNVPMFDQGYSNSRDYFLSTGLSAGISFDYPISERLILNLTANYAALARFQVAHSEYNDLYNEYYDGNSMIFDLFGSAGVGLRYSFKGKE